MPDFSSFPHARIFSWLYKICQPEGWQVYLVGGAVRDILLKRQVHDLDFIVIGDALKAGRRLADRLGGSFFILDDERHTARVFIPTETEKMVVDVAELRAGSLEEDLRARDFTVNAIALDLAEPNRVIDPLGGAVDLKDKVIRYCSVSSFEHDPIRVLRAIRMALSLGARIQPETLARMRQAIPLLKRSAMERHREELFRMLSTSRVSSAIRLLKAVGVLDELFPELGTMVGVPQPELYTLTVWEHSLATVEALEKLLGVLAAVGRSEDAENLVMGSAKIKLLKYSSELRVTLDASLVDNRSKRSLLFLAALYHDVGKPEGMAGENGYAGRSAEILTEAAKNLALSQVETNYLLRIVQYHTGGHSPFTVGMIPSRRDVYRFFRSAGEAGIAACLLSLADTLAAYGNALLMAVWETELEICRALFAAWYDQNEELVNPVLLINGDDLLSHLNIPQGPIVGEILAAVREAQAIGDISDRQAALRLAQALSEEKSDRKDGSER